MTTARIAAVILAGGKGERLGGVIKANLTIGGVRLIDRVTQALAGSVSTILVAHGRVDSKALALRPGHVAIPDLASDYGGPLAGLAAAVAWCGAQPQSPEYLISVAVDTPFFPADFVSRALAAVGTSHPAVVARYGGQDYPTDAIWRLTSVGALPDLVLTQAAPRSLWRFAAELGAGRLDWPQSPAGDPFASANTPDDVRVLEARAATE